jgi:hypothetical protein
LDAESGTVAGAMGDIAAAELVISRDGMKERETIARLSYVFAVLGRKEGGQGKGELGCFLDRVRIFYFAINLRFGSARGFYPVLPDTPPNSGTRHNNTTVLDIKL